MAVDRGRAALVWRSNGGRLAHFFQSR